MSSSPRPLTRSALAVGASALALVLVASVLDSWSYSHLAWPGVDNHDWGRLLRVMGFLPLWFGAGAAAYLSATSATGRRGALVLVGATTTAGALGEVLKLLIRRERPDANAGSYVFRSFSDRPFSTRGLGMPSSHAIVAFAAATVLARLWPRGSVIWYGLAVGCALTRVLSRAHFLSDVVVAALVGSAVAAFFWRVFALPAQPPTCAVAD